MEVLLYITIQNKCKQKNKRNIRHNHNDSLSEDKRRQQIVDWHTHTHK